LRSTLFPYTTLFRSNLIFYWQADPENRAPLEIINANDSSASVNLSQNSPPGEYYFNLFTVEEDGDTAKARTFITIDDEEIKPFRSEEHTSELQSREN